MGRRVPAGMSDYWGSDGRRYDDREIWERLEGGRWRVCCWDDESGMEVVETVEGDLLFLVPTERAPDEGYVLES